MSDAPALLVEDLSYHYPGSSERVTDVSRLALAPGEQVLLTGGSGSGKSTLLHLIAGLMEPSSGRVIVDGQDVHALSGAKRDLFRGTAIGMVFQTFNLLHGFSAMENVMMALLFSNVPRKEHKERAASLLERLGIDRVDAAPESMSIGQQQRVAAARAVACHPALVLADEPTASLDPENAVNAIGLIQEACRETGAALLCVSHDPGMADRFERRMALGELSRASV